MTRTTLADIAAKTGYSQTTVGKVLNGGNASIRISESTRNKIIEAARKMHYHPHAMASALRKGNANIIGLLGDSMAGRRIAMLIQEIERHADARSYRLLTSMTHDDIDSMYSNYLALMNHGAAGVICLAHDYPDMREHMCELFANDDRIVFLEQPQWGPGHYVGTSRRKALAEYFRYHKQCGRKRFGLIHANLRWHSERALLADYRAALKDNDMQFIPELAVEYPDEDGSLEYNCDYIIDKMIIPHQPDVLFSDDAEHALYLQNQLLARKISLPVICGGNHDPFFRIAAPAIDSLDPHYDRIASALIGAVIDRQNFVSGITVDADAPVPAC